MEAEIKIEKWDVEELIPQHYNPRKLTAKKRKDLKQSLEKHGWLEPLVVNVHPDRYGNLVGGHQRLSIAKDLGYTKVPCSEKSYATEEEEKEANIRLNQNGGEWDYDLLKVNFDLNDLAEYGFDSFELKPMLLDEKSSEEVEIEKRVIVYRTILDRLEGKLVIDPNNPLVSKRLRSKVEVFDSSKVFKATKEEVYK